MVLGSVYRSYGRLDALARHPYDKDVWIGAVGALHSLPPGVDAVVSLCRIDPTTSPPASRSSRSA